MACFPKPILKCLPFTIKAVDIYIGRQVFFDVWVVNLSGLGCVKALRKLRYIPSCNTLCTLISVLSPGPGLLLRRGRRHDIALCSCVHRATVEELSSQCYGWTVPCANSGEMSLVCPRLRRMDYRLEPSTFLPSCSQPAHISTQRERTTQIKVFLTSSKRRT